MSNKTEKPLYFIAVIPPEPVLSEAQDLKQLFASEYNSKAALKSPPHITLHMPFRLKPEKEPLLINTLNSVSEKLSEIKLELKGFGHFNQRVIYIDVAENEKLEQLYDMIIKAMKQRLNIFNADYKDRGYNPHLTVAFRDLKKAEFKRAWPNFKDQPFHKLFLANSFTLLKHNGKHWDIFKSFDLSSNL